MQRALTNIEEEMILQIEEYEKQINIEKEEMRHHKRVITFSIIEFLWVGVGLFLYYNGGMGYDVGIELMYIFIEFWLLVIWIYVVALQLAHKHDIRFLKRQEQNILDKLAIFKVKYDPETKKVEFMD